MRAERVSLSFAPTLICHLQLRLSNLWYNSLMAPISTSLRSAIRYATCCASVGFVGIWERMTDIFSAICHLLIDIVTRKNIVDCAKGEHEERNFE